MEKYKLKKDTLFYEAGTICKLTPKGNLVLDGCEGTCVINRYKLEKFPGLLEEWFEKFKERKYGGRAPKRNDRYWHIDAEGYIQSAVWGNIDIHLTVVDEKRFESGSAFWSWEEAEKELRRRQAYVILKEDTKGFVPTWGEDGRFKYYIYYSYIDHDFIVESARYLVSDRIYFATIEDAEASIKAHRQQWLDYLGIEEEE